MLAVRKKEFTLPLHLVCKCDTNPVFSNSLCIVFPFGVLFTPFCLHIGGPRLVLHVCNIHAHHCAHCAVYTKRCGLLWRTRHCHRCNTLCCHFGVRHHSFKHYGTLYITKLFTLHKFRFFSMTACSDPGIIFAIKEIESTHHGEGNDMEMMARSPSQSQPYSPVRSTDLIQDIPDNPCEPNLLNTRNGEEIEDIEEGFANKNNYLGNDIKPNNVVALDTPFDGNVLEGAANRIVVGAAQRASRSANLNHSSSSSSNNSASSGANVLASTQINAPYLPPPSKIECGRCQLLRPRDASHCHDCGVCVKKLDHHCPVSLSSV